MFFISALAHPFHKSWHASMISAIKALLDFLRTNHQPPFHASSDPPYLPRSCLAGSHLFYVYPSDSKPNQRAHLVAYLLTSVHSFSRLLCAQGFPRSKSKKLGRGRKRDDFGFRSHIEVKPHGNITLVMLPPQPGGSGWVGDGGTICCLGHRIWLWAMQVNAWLANSLPTQCTQCYRKLTYLLSSLFRSFGGPDDLRQPPSNGY